MCILGKTIKHQSSNSSDLSYKNSNEPQDMMIQKVSIKKVPSRSTVRFLSVTSNIPRSSRVMDVNQDQLIMPLTLNQNDKWLMNANSQPRFIRKGGEAVRLLPDLKNQVEIVKYANGMSLKRYIF